MPAKKNPSVSFIIATHNRRETVVNTLTRLQTCGLDRDDFEIMVIDNASTDGTAEAVSPLCDVLVPSRKNLGSCAKSLGVDRARGPYLVFLDDDAIPQPGSMVRMIRHFEEEPHLAAAGFTIHLPDGRQEASALPGVFHGCTVGLRADALRRAGNLDRSFFMQAEEYDLSFRLVNAGWSCEVFDDLHADHLKTPQARRSDRVTFLNVRNNLRLISRYLPAEAATVYRQDWLDRYRLLAEIDGHRASFDRGRRAARFACMIERLSYRRWRLCPPAFEYFFRWEMVLNRMQELAAPGLRTVILADLGKNIYPFFRAARAVGVRIAAIADDRFGSGSQYWYRGIPVLPFTDAVRHEADAIVVSNMARPFAAETARRCRLQSRLPVHDWFGEPADSVEAESDPASESADGRSIESAATHDVQAVTV